MPEITRLTAIAERHGARIGVSDLAPFEDVHEAIVSRNESGMAGGLGFTYRDPALSATPQTSFPWAASVVVVAMPYLRAGDGPDTASATRSIARFADEDRYEPLRRLLKDLAGALEADGCRTEVVLDDDRLVDRAIAVRAGIAWWGKSTMALAPGLGPWFLIGNVVTDGRFDPTPPMQRSCGTCTACIPACPTGAIVEPGVLDARRCLASVFQSRGAIPRELRPLAGGRVYGCDECLLACPPGDRAIDHLAVRETIDPAEVLAQSDSSLDSEFQHWYVPGRNMRFVRRNALVAIGNLGRHSDVSMLAGYLGHPDPLLREHAAWALGAIGGEPATAALRAALEHETDADVRDELVGATST
ncbi:MAG: tRNA epoxyqueuosine(34) reductase QueG [Acidimicrobiia bacterium]